MPLTRENSNHENRHAQVPDVEIFYVPQFFPDPPQPLPGVDLMLIDEVGHVGWNPKTGKPIDTAINIATGNPLWQSSDEFQRLVDSYGVNQSKRAAVRQKLFDMRVMGHSVTSPYTDPEDQLARAYQIMRFGLWPEYNTKNQSNLPYPWIGYFGEPGGGDAGEKFHDIAFIPHHQETATFVHLPDNYGGGSFIPPTEMTMIVPNQKLKERLIVLFQKDIVAKRDPQTIQFLHENILTYDDILAMENETP